MNDQPGWYEAQMHRVDFLGHTEPRRNDEMHEYLKRGGKLSDYPGNAKFSIGQFNIVDLSCGKAGVASATVGVADLWTGANRAEVSASLPNAESRADADPWSRFDRALGLTPQMEKAETQCTI